MKRKFLQVILVGLLALSVGTAATVFVGVASGQDFGGGGSCPKACDRLGGCPGSTCSCTFDSGTNSHYCAP
jgi:hypothetical protein